MRACVRARACVRVCVHVRARHLYHMLNTEDRCHRPFNMQPNLVVLFVLRGVALYVYEKWSRRENTLREREGGGGGGDGGRERE